VVIIPHVVAIVLKLGWKFSGPKIDLRIATKKGADLSRRTAR
jgi:hypothetical protein